MFAEPLAGKRKVKVTEHRTRQDWAEAMRELADVDYPEADVIVVVMDNLNTHSPASFYEAFEPQEARRLANRFEFHYTPKHGSWLNMAEIEFSVLGRQCLAGRISDMATLENRVNAWQKERMLQLLRFIGGSPPPKLASNWHTCILRFRFDRLLGVLANPIS